VDENLEWNIWPIISAQSPTEPEPSTNQIHP
jgi:hypothetical protein